jgi:hypothetical protein
VFYFANYALGTAFTLKKKFEHKVLEGEAFLNFETLIEN